MKSTTLAVITSALVALSWVSTPPANPTAASPAPPVIQGAKATDTPPMAPEPDDDEDEHKPRRARRN